MLGAVRVSYLIDWVAPITLRPRCRITHGYDLRCDKSKVQTIVIVHKAPPVAADHHPNSFHFYKTIDFL